MSPVPIPES